MRNIFGLLAVVAFVALYATIAALETGAISCGFALVNGIASVFTFGVSVSVLASVSEVEHGRK